MKKSYHKRHRLKPKKPFFKKRAFWLFFFLLVLVVGGIYFFVFFKPLQVNKIIILGNKEVLAKELEGLISTNIKRKLCFGITLAGFQNIFLVNSAKINEVILKEYPIIDSLTIKKILPNILEVNILERKPFAVLYKQDKYFFIDEKGVVFKEASGNLANLPILRQTSIAGSTQLESDKMSLGREIIKREIVEKIAEIKKALEERSRISIKEADIVSEGRLNIKTEENWEVYFNLTADINLQIEKLVLLLEQELPKQSRSKLQYIDLRFKDRAYYK